MAYKPPKSSSPSVPTPVGGGRPAQNRKMKASATSKKSVARGGVKAASKKSVARPVVKRRTK